MIYKHVIGGRLSKDDGYGKIDDYAGSDKIPEDFQSYLIYSHEEQEVSRSSGRKTV